MPKGLEYPVVDVLPNVDGNCVVVKLELLEKKGKLVAEFPNPSLISNGQRDILVFIAKLLKAEVKLHGDNSILIIDEIFDYLDEANLVSAQYYINKFIETFREKNKKIYVIIMTHLDPVVFQSYYFKNLHIYYLSKSQRKPNEKIIEKLLIYRNKKENKFTDEQIDKMKMNIELGIGCYADEVKNISISYADLDFVDRILGVKGK